MTRRVYIAAATLIGVAIVAIVGAALYLGVWGSHPTIALDTFNRAYTTQNTRLDTCSVCHSFGRRTNVYGSEVKSALREAIGDNSMQLTEAQVAEQFVASLKNVEALDSDGDGFSNMDEIAARTLPGDPDDHPLGDR